ncbi:MAG TPA: 50S ribosomal protein L25/general stress protein Ctc [Xanthobacteraceae bacterium]|nr:50S ribosomal protein L25/general stress protein Ctc [Xanthobacteraceae bacterium]
MATVKVLKATARPKVGKGAARAERRAGRVPAVIYGDNKAPLTISLEEKQTRQAIYAGHFLTTVFEIDLDGAKHSVIPRDFYLDPVKDFPVHVDFLRLGEGASIRVGVPVRVKGSEVSPGVKRGGTVNIVSHAVELEARIDLIPQFIEVDVSKLEINNSVHLSDIELPEGVKPVLREAQTLVTIVPPSGYSEAAASAEAAPAAAPAAGAKAPAAAKK